LNVSQDWLHSILSPRAVISIAADQAGNGKSYQNDYSLQLTGIVAPTSHTSNVLVKFVKTETLTFLQTNNKTSMAPLSG
jgi:hypothetical protein